MCNDSILAGFVYAMFYNHLSPLFETKIYILVQ